MIPRPCKRLLIFVFDLGSLHIINHGNGAEFMIFEKRPMVSIIFCDPMKMGRAFFVIFSSLWNMEELRQKA